MKQNKIRIDTFFYHIGKIIWLPALIAGSWFTKTGFETYKGYMACSIYRMTHIPCPGCGGTRAVYHFFLGHFKESFCFHPVVIIGVIAYLHFMLLYFLRKHICNTINQKEIHIEYYVYLLSGVTVIQWLVKVIGILL